MDKSEAQTDLIAQYRGSIDFTAEYLECWANAMTDGDEGAKTWKQGGKAWTIFHEKKVLVPLSGKINDRSGREELHEAEPPEVMEKEYYRIDFIFYRYIDRSRHFWTLDYAIEHENKQFDADSKKIKTQGWFDEFCKLIPIRCTKARVIIGYDLFDGNTVERLDRCDRMRKAHEAYHDITDTPILLILFPATAHILENPESSMVRAILFVQRDGKWERADIMSEVGERMIADRNIEQCDTLANKLRKSFEKIAGVTDEK